MSNNQSAVLFTNIFDQDFVGVWDKTEYPIPAGATMMLQEYLAKHFAKHLVNQCHPKILSMVEDSNGIPKDTERRKLYERIIKPTGIKAKNEAELGTKLMNAKMEDTEEEDKPVKKVVGKPAVKKVVTKDEEFEGLEDDNLKDGTTTEKTK